MAVSYFKIQPRVSLWHSILVVPDSQCPRQYRTGHSQACCCAHMCNPRWKTGTWALISSSITIKSEAFSCAINCLFLNFIFTGCTIVLCQNMSCICLACPKAAMRTYHNNRHLQSHVSEDHKYGVEVCAGLLSSGGCEARSATGLLLPVVAAAQLSCTGFGPTLMASS